MKWMLISARALALSLATTANAQPASQDASSTRFFVAPSISLEGRVALTGVYAQLARLPRRTRPTSVQQWEALRSMTEARLTPKMAATAKRMQLTTQEDTIGGVPVLRIRKAGSAPTGRTLVYLHGGGYVFFSAKTSIILPGLLADASGDEVISVDYTVAPGGTWPIVTDQVLAVWRALLARGIPAAQIGLVGDSAGGGLAAGSVLKMRDQGLPLPGALYLLSPWADVTATDDATTTLANADPILNNNELAWGANVYAAPTDQRNPYVSPVYGDYQKPFPPTLIQSGTHDMFLSHSVREYQAIRGGGHEAILDMYEGMPHVWQVLAPSIPETRVAIDRAVAFLHSHLPPR